MRPAQYYVADRAFKRLIFMLFPIAESKDHTGTKMDNLTYEVANALCNNWVWADYSTSERWSIQD